jgi:hypothetical protein
MGNGEEGLEGEKILIGVGKNWRCQLGGWMLRTKKKKKEKKFLNPTLVVQRREYANTLGFNRLARSI